MSRDLRPRFDPGWLYVLPGAVVVAATVVVPAQDDLAKAEWRVAQARAVEEHRAQRIRNYSAYMDAVECRDETVVLELAATQLNLAPAGKTPLPTATDASRMSFNASIFPTLEPPPPAMPELRLPDTLLRRLTTNDHTRLWLVAACAISPAAGS